MCENLFWLTGQWPGPGANMVMGQIEQWNNPGAKLYIDNLFTSLDLLNHLGDKHIGIMSTILQNWFINIPFPSKKKAKKEMKRGEAKAVYSEDVVVLVWMDNQAVYIASDCNQVEPMGQCQRYPRAEKLYKVILPTSSAPIFALQ
jgi:hypothetical protein